MKAEYIIQTATAAWSVWLRQRSVLTAPEPPETAHQRSPPERRILS